MVGLILAIINFEHDTTISEDAIDLNVWPDPMKHPRNTNSTACILRMIIALTSVLSLITLYMRHFYQMKWVNNFLQQ